MGINRFAPLTASFGWPLSIAVLLSVLLCSSRAQPAEVDPAESPPSATGEPNTLEELADQQTSLAEKYRRLEAMMLKMAEFDAGSNPRRAALLKQALSESKDKHIRLQMETLATRLRQQQLQRAVDDQTQVRDDLKTLLELLLSENRADRLRNQQARIRDYIKEVERILRQQRGIQGRTEGGGDPLELAKDQDEVADRTAELADTIEQNERPASDQGNRAGNQDASSPSGEEPSREADPSTEEGDPSDRQDPSREERSDDETPSDSSDRDAEPSPSEETQPGEGSEPNDASQPEAERPAADSNASPSESSAPEGSSPSESGEPSDSSSPSPTPGPPSSSSPRDESPPAPGQERVAQAEQRMRQAQEQLEQAQREEALEEQEEARRLLEEAKAELEEILRQLREEEIQRTLAQLEERFRKMLEAQLKIYEETQRLDRIPDEQQGSQVVIQAGKLSLEQRRLVGEADKSLLLLREEGSSVAFPESVEQMRADMEQVAERLAEAKVERITLGLEEDIIAALEEMIEALQQAQQEAEQRQQQPPPPGSMNPQDQPLVDAIAELKMIRALQMRVNTRTERYARLLDDPEHPVGQATNDDLVQSLIRLAEREARIRQITRDIVLGKNK